MKILLYVVGVFMVVAGLLLLLAQPIIGVLAMAAGAAELIYARKWKRKVPTGYVTPTGERTEQKSIKTNEFVVAGFDYRQDELRELLTTENEDYNLTGKSFIDDIGEKTFEYLPEWYTAILKDENNEHDPNAIAVYVGKTHIGYVARKDHAKVRQLIPGKYEVEVIGGRYKDIDCDEFGENWHIIKGETPYKAILYITSEKSQ